MSYITRYQDLDFREALFNMCVSENWTCVTDAEVGWDSEVRRAGWGCSGVARAERSAARLCW